MPEDVVSPPTIDTATVRMAVPSSPRFIGAVRATAASLANDLGFSLDDIDDLRLGIDEALSLLVEASPEETSIAVGFHLGEDEIEVQIRTDELARDVVVDDLAAHVLGAVTEDFDVSGSNVRLRKTRTSR